MLDSAYMRDSINQYYAGVNWLTNVNQYYPHYSIACHNGWYDTLDAWGWMYISDTCVADAFVDAYPDKGACAFLGNTRFGWGPDYSTDLEYEFYSSLFSPYIGPYPPEPSVTRLGVSEALSKCGQRIDWSYMGNYGFGKFVFLYVFVAYTHTLFGSPYTEVWTNQPRNFSVSHRRRIFSGVQYQFRVTVKDAENGASVAHAKVCLNKPNDIYEVGYTDNNGEITFTITARTHGQLKVTVTRIHDNNTFIQYYPSETYCEVFDVSEGEQASEIKQIMPTALCITQIPTYAKHNLPIKFGIPETGDITISIYDATGSKKGGVIIENLIPGYYQRDIDIKKFAGGIYFVVLKQNNEQVSRKFLLIK